MTVDDTISRQTAIDALWKALYEYEDKTEKQFTESDELDVEDWVQHRIFVQNMNDIDRQTILNLPSAQPELIEKVAYIRGFEQGRTQGMIDNTIKAEWTNADALDLQPTCNQLATDCISRQAAIDALHGYFDGMLETDTWSPCDVYGLIEILPSAQPKQRPLTEDNYAYCAECDPEVKCLSCGHHIAERPFEVYCNIMCKWVNEKDCCTMFEHGQEKMRKTETQI